MYGASSTPLPRRDESADSEGPGATIVDVTDLLSLV